MAISSGRAGADEFHYTNILVGVRAAGLGGAYTAVSDDPSGLYYNPAGVAFAPAGGRLSASVNAFYMAEKSFESALGAFDWQRTSSSLLPNFFGIVHPLGPGKLGISYAVPDSVVEDQDQVFRNFHYDVTDVDVESYGINFVNGDKTYQFGPSYSLRLGEDFSVGATLYLHYRRHKEILNVLTTFEDPTLAPYWANRYIEQSETGIRPILGLMWSPPEKPFSVGLTVARTFLFDAENRLQVTTDRGGSITQVITESDEARALPIEARLGLAWFPTPSLLVSGDLAWYDRTDEVVDESVGLVVWGRRDSVVNGAIGLEYYPHPKFAVRTGAFTNFSATPEIGSGSAGADEHVDLYGVSLSFSLFTGSSSVTVGGTYGFGSGKAQINADDPLLVQNTRSDTLLLYIGTSYAY